VIPWWRRVRYRILLNRDAYGAYGTWTMRETSRRANRVAL